jgi:hypothetical protein
MIRTSILAPILILVLTGCHLPESFQDKEPTPHSYSSIKASKSHNVFLTRYLPISTSMSIEGVNFKVSEAWVEHPHYWAGNDFVSCKDLDFVMTFENTTKNNIDLHDYMEDLTGGGSQIWFFLSEKEYLPDTLKIKYKDREMSEDQKTFSLIKAKDQ